MPHPTEHDEFLIAFARELRGQMSPLRDALESMRRAPDDHERIGWARAAMERQLAQMERLIDDLLELSRASRGHIELHYEEVQLADLVNGALGRCGPAIREGGHLLSVEIPHEAVAVHCDPARMIQVLCHLLSNAAKYTQGRGRIEVVAGQGPGGIEISVRDNGIGIPSDRLARIFDRSTQVGRPHERSQDGLGIGLVLVKRLVELHRGSIQARSKGVGHGSEFIVRLPQRVVIPLRPPRAVQPDNQPLSSRPSA